MEDVIGAVVRCPCWRIRSEVDKPPLFGSPLEVERGSSDSSPMTDFNREMKQRRDPRRVGLRGRTSERLTHSTNLRWNHLGRSDVGGSRE